jgi:hypothetical protein
MQHSLKVFPALNCSVDFGNKIYLELLFSRKASGDAVSSVIQVCVEPGMLLASSARPCCMVVAKAKTQRCEISYTFQMFELFIL